MKNLILILVIFLFSCEKEREKVLTPIGITVFDHVRLGMSKSTLENRINKKIDNSWIHYKMQGLNGVSEFLARFDDTTVVDILYYANPVNRNPEFNANYQSEIHKKYDYGTRIGIVWDRYSVGDLLEMDSTEVKRMEIYSYKEYQDAEAFVIGFTRFPGERVGALRLLKKGFIFEIN
jgi:hypothetical protein